ncbi:DEAD/DEAH box helicase [Listeria sp. PSOL-1]|uniref:DEAD/DEAH box helicase n=1 Tax=Listeria sp. PSOL-1 TaxID=1844999 RepID=UPI0013CFF433|nr:DEAD/DEAH box helicase [Listeria sp. PSOL-1]
MIPYHIKQEGKQLLLETKIIRTELENERKYAFSDGEIVTSKKEDHFDCSCPFHQEEGSVCKHIYAAYLDEKKWQQQVKQKSIKERILEQEAETMLSLFQTNVAKQFDHRTYIPKMKLHVEYILKIKQQLLSLELKIGMTRTYVVKNINAFLKAISKQQLLEFTKSFTFDPSEHDFYEEDKQIFEALIQMNDIAKLYETEEDYWMKSYASDKMLTIPSSMASDFIKQLTTRDTQVQILSAKNELQLKYLNPKYSEGKLALDFSLTEREHQQYTLELDAFRQAVFLENYYLIFCDGIFYTELKPIWHELTPLIEFSKITHAEFIQFNEAKLSEVISYILPALEKCGHVDIDESIKARMMKPPLKAKLSLFLQDKRHALRLRYQYEDQTFDPFVEEGIPSNQKAIMIRDIEKESLIMHLIENAPIQFSNGQMVVSSKEEDLYLFYYDVLPELSKVLDVETSDALDQVILNTVKPHTSLELTNDHHYLAISFDFEGIPEQEINAVLESLREKRRYHRLKDGRFISLESKTYQQLSNVFDLLEVRKKDVKKKLIVPFYRGVQIYQALDAENEQKYQHISHQIYQALTEITTQSKTQYSPPKGLHAKLRDYQITGFRWLKSLAKYRLGGILADDMGLGKTVQTITYLLSELEDEPELAPILIVTPASLLYNWLNEWQKFAPEVPVTVIHGTKETRKKQVAAITSGQVYLISYPSLRQDDAFFKNHHFSTVILDESQAIKNYHTKASQVVRSLKCENIFALSGTPLENSTDELWAIFQTIMPGFFPSLRKFKELSHEKVAKMIAPFLMRRLKQEVVRELPEKIDTNLYSELTTEQKTIYLAYLEKIQQDLSKTEFNQGEERMKLLAGLTRLRQICCDPSLFIENYHDDSGKLLQLFDTIQTAEENNKRILIFSQFTSMLKIIRDRLTQAGYHSFYMDGKTPAKERVELVEAFNQGEERLFLISLKAGGTGLNLTGADTVILYDLWWNPAVEEQAASRAHRIGQKNVVQVIRMIARGTIEEKIYNLQKKKQAIVDDLIQPGEKLLNKLTIAEIKEILKID